MDFYGVIIETKEEAVDIIAEGLYEIGVKGIEIIDNYLSKEDRSNLIVDYIDEDIIPLEFVKIKCYFSSQENIEEKEEQILEILEDVGRYINIGTGKIERILTKEEDWAENWKKYYKTFSIGKNIIIKPSWEAPIKPDDNRIVIEIDPGMAFGSGTHDTSSMCVLGIEKYLQSGDNVIDVGCGSGILSIAAAKLGAGRVQAIDIDKAAVKVAKENIELNQLEDIISVHHGNLLEESIDKADIVVANIMADAILMLVEDIKRVLVKDGLFISSGIISSRKDEIVTKLKACGFEIIDSMQSSEWIALFARLKE